MAEKQHYSGRLPRRIGFIVSAEERLKLNALLEEASNIKRAEHQELDKVCKGIKDSKERVEVFTKAYAEIKQTEQHQRLEAIRKEVDKLGAEIDRRYASTFLDETAFYEQVISLINSLSLTLDERQQKGFIEMPFGELINPDVKISYGQEIKVDFALYTDPDIAHKNCVDFLLSFVDVQNLMEVAKIKGWSLDLFYKTAEERANALGYKASNKKKKPTMLGAYPKQDANNELVLRVNNGIGTIVKKDFYNIPNSTASDLILTVLGAGEDIADLPERKKKVNHSNKLEVTESGNKRRVTQTNGKSSVTVELGDIELIYGAKNPARKLFIQALRTANEQAFSNGHLIRDYVCFPLTELVDIGLYKNERTAKQGFLKGADALTSIKVKGHIEKSKKNASTIDTLEVLFTGAKVEKGLCFLRLNYAIDWSFLVQYFTILPNYYFRLSNRASDLLYYIFYLARQHTEDIEEKGYFTISFRAIQQRLQLPSENQTKNPQRDIRDEIEKAIEQIEEAHKNAYGIKDIDKLEFTLLPLVDDRANIYEYLEKGKLQISLKGNFAKTFIEISQNTAKQIESKRKRTEKIREEALIRNLAKKMGDEN